MVNSTDVLKKKCKKENQQKKKERPTPIATLTQTPTATPSCFYNRHTHDVHTRAPSNIIRCFHLICEKCCLPTEEWKKKEGKKPCVCVCVVSRTLRGKMMKMCEGIENRLGSK